MPNCGAVPGELFGHSDGPACPHHGQLGQEGRPAPPWALPAPWELGTSYHRRQARGECCSGRGALASLHLRPGEVRPRRPRPGPCRPLQKEVNSLGPPNSSSEFLGGSERKEAQAFLKSRASCKIRAGPWRCQPSAGSPVSSPLVPYSGPRNIPPSLFSRPAERGRDLRAVLHLPQLSAGEPAPTRLRHSPPVTPCSSVITGVFLPSGQLLPRLDVFQQDSPDPHFRGRTVAGPSVALRVILARRLLL